MKSNGVEGNRLNSRDAALIERLQRSDHSPFIGLAVGWISIVIGLIFISLYIIAIFMGLARQNIWSAKAVLYGIILLLIGNYRLQNFRYLTLISALLHSPQFAHAEDNQVQSGDASP